VAAEVPEDTPEAVRERLVSLLGPDEGHEVAAAICHSAGLAVDDRQMALTRMEQRELIAGAWRRYLQAVSRDARLIVWVEDLHWADPVLVRIIDHITTDLQAPLFVLATARPEFEGSAHLRPRANRLQIDLEPLDAKASELLARSAGRERTDTARAAGNPLFIIELARSRSATGATPVTIQAAIEARLDELPPPERELLRLASVAGETFDIRDAALLSGREPAEVAGMLGRVTHLGFVEPVGSRYRFHHVLVRDVAYGRLPVEERMAQHARFAVDGVDPADVEALAHHWWQALEPPDAEWVWNDPARLRAMRGEALGAHLAAGRRLEDRNAYEESLEVYARALQLADDAADVARAEAAVGRAFARQGRGDEAWEHRQRAISAFAEAGLQPPAELYADMLEIATFNWGYFQRVPDEAEVLRLLDEGERIARQSGDDVSFARLLVERAAFTNDLAGADEITRFVESPDAAQFADPAQRAAEAFLLDGKISRAMELYRTVFERLLPAGAIINEPEALLWYGVAALHAGDLGRTDSLADRLRDVATRRSPHTRQHAHGLTALLHLARGDWDDVAHTSRDLAEVVDANPQASFCLIGAAAAGYGAIVDILAGRPMPDGLNAFVARLVPQSVPIQASTMMLPKVMAGDQAALEAGLAAYAPRLQLVDRQRQWDACDLMPAIGMTMLERWDQLGPSLARMDQFARGGSRFAEAAASAIREEQAAAEGGPPPAHDQLRARGFDGISALLRFRPARVGA
jgi:tetratricopeptide (TPR) repeat protein